MSRCSRMMYTNPFEVMSCKRAISSDWFVASDATRPKKTSAPPHKTASISCYMSAILSTNAAGTSASTALRKHARCRPFRTVSTQQKIAMRSRWPTIATFIKPTSVIRICKPRAQIGRLSALGTTTSFPMTTFRVTPPTTTTTWKVPLANRTRIRPGLSLYPPC